MKHLSTFLLSALMLFAFTAKAQLDLPKPSPQAEMEQRIGLTDIEIEYSRPGAKGRTIFGDLVPFDKVWRTGANKATYFESSTDFMFGGKEVPAGEYSLFSIPGKKQWTIILNSETELWGTGDYDEAKDVARIEVKPTKTKDMYETFTIGIEAIEDEKATMFLAWENTKVSWELGVKTYDQAMKNIAEEIDDIENSWRVYVQSADYMASTGKELEKALEYTEKALEVEEYWWTYWVQGEVYAAMGEYKKAAKSIKKSIKAGEEVEGWGYKERLEKILAEYEEKA